MITKYKYLYLILPIILITNAPLFWGFSNSIFYLNQSLTQNGEFWRFFTHAFAHLSLYHMLTDLFIFFILFYEITDLPNNNFYSVMIFSLTCSSFIAWLSMPLHHVDSFAGISGINYGLITYFCLFNLKYLNTNKKELFLWTSVLILIIAKPILDLIFPFHSISNFHIGYVGTIISESHSGGILAALIICLFENRKKVQLIN